MALVERVPADRHPWWVKFCTWIGHSRRAQWIYVALSAVSAAGCFGAIALLNLRTSTAIILSVSGIGFLISVVWYWLTIRWIDRYGTWPQ